MRLPDSTAGRATCRPLRAPAAHRSTEAIPRGDTVPVPAPADDDRRRPHGLARAAGLVKVDRETVVEASLPAGGRIRAPVRSRVVQRGRLSLLPRAACP